MFISSCALILSVRNSNSCVFIIKKHLGKSSIETVENANCFVVNCCARRCAQSTAYCAPRLRLAFCIFIQFQDYFLFLPRSVLSRFALYLKLF